MNSRLMKLIGAGKMNLRPIKLVGAGKGDFRLKPAFWLNLRKAVLLLGLLMASSLAFASGRGKGLCQSFFEQPIQTIQTTYQQVTAPRYKTINGDWLVSNQESADKELAQKRLWLFVLNKPSLLFKEPKKIEEYHELSIRSYSHLMEAVQKQAPKLFEIMELKELFFIIINLEPFIESGADIYAEDEHGWTLLDYLASSGSLELVQALDHIAMKTVKSGYRSFLQSRALGLGAPFYGYNPSDFRRAISIAEKMKEESGEEIEIGSYDDLIEYLNLRIPRVRNEQIHSALHVLAIYGLPIILYFYYVYLL